jgi:glycosyltransferase involved in cell wall biosynthesis
MKILIINYRFFVSGGPERYMFNLINLLKSKGHKVIPFSIRYTSNNQSDFSDYFVSPLSSEKEVYFQDYKLNIRSIKKIIERLFYSTEVYNNLAHLIIDMKPDFAIVLHYLKKLSPAVIKCLDDNGIPFIVRISDFLMICPNAHLIRKGKICELCIHKGLINSVKYKCVQNSYSMSLLNYLAIKFHNKKKYFDKIIYFVVPSKFTIFKMIEAGYDPSRLIHLPTFVDILSQEIIIERKRQIVFVGRMERIKGVHILLSAVNHLKNKGVSHFNCLIIGDGDKEYIEELCSFVKVNTLSNVKFLGKLEKEEIDFHLRESLFSVVPSIWYDNQPNTVLESLANGTPVIASNHGSFPEIVIDNTTGFLFNPNDILDLAKKINILIDNSELRKKMSYNAIEFIRANHSSERHFQILINIYTKLKTNGLFSQK